MSENQGFHHFSLFIRQDFVSLGIEPDLRVREREEGAAAWGSVDPRSQPVPRQRRDPERAVQGRGMESALYYA